MLSSPTKPQATRLITLLSDDKRILLVCPVATMYMKKKISKTPAAATVKPMYLLIFLGNSSTLNRSSSKAFSAFSSAFLSEEVTVFRGALTIISLFSSSEVIKVAPFALLPELVA
jgi:hypothetical protein